MRTHIVARTEVADPADDTARARPPAAAIA